MNIFEISTELFDDSDNSTGSIETTSISSISSNSNNSITSSDRSMARSTRQSEMGSSLSNISGLSSRDHDTSDSDSSNNPTGSNQSLSSSISESEGINSSNSSQSSDTELYDVDEEIERSNNNPVIEINDTQMPNNDDDDVILIPQNIETIDLCTQSVVIPLRLRNEVIEITDSPGRDNSYAGPIRRERRNRQNTHSAYVNDIPTPVPQRPTTSTPNARQQLNMNDSLDDQPKVALTCPICLDSVVNRVPVSTNCGHIFCQQCIVEALRSVKKCPMCKKGLGGRKPYFNIYLPC